MCGGGGLYTTTYNNYTPSRCTSLKTSSSVKVFGHIRVFTSQMQDFYLLKKMKRRNARLNVTKRLSMSKSSSMEAKLSFLRCGFWWESLVAAWALVLKCRPSLRGPWGPCASSSCALPCPPGPSDGPSGAAGLAGDCAPSHGPCCPERGAGRGRLCPCLVS